MQVEPAFQPEEPAEDDQGIYLYAEEDEEDAAADDPAAFFNFFNNAEDNGGDNTIRPPTSPRSEAHSSRNVTSSQAGAELENQLAEEYENLLKGFGRKFYRGPSDDNDEDEDEVESELQRRFLRNSSIELSPQEKVVLKIQGRLPLEQINELLAVMDSCQWKSVADLERWFEEVPELGQPWSNHPLINICGKVYSVGSVKDIRTTLQEFATKGALVDKPGELRNSKGERLYGTIQLSEMAQKIYVSRNSLVFTYLNFIIWTTSDNI